MFISPVAGGIAFMIRNHFSPEISIIERAKPILVRMSIYHHRADLYPKNWLDQIQDGRLAAILNAENPLFISADDLL